MIRGRGHVVARQVGPPGQLDRAVEERLLGLVGQRPGRRFQERAIELVADALDVAGLLGAQDVAGAADFQVAQGDLEAGPQLGELLDRLQPLDGVGRDRLVRLEQQVGVGPVLVAADPAAELVQVGQAVLVGLVDEDRVDVGDVQAALDDRRRDQDVELAG